MITAPPADKYFIYFKMKGPDTNYQWRTFECVLNSIEECISFYELNDPEVEYLIIKVQPLTRRL